MTALTLSRVENGRRAVGLCGAHGHVRRVCTRASAGALMCGVGVGSLSHPLAVQAIQQALVDQRASDPPAAVNAQFIHPTRKFAVSSCVEGR